LPCLYVYDQYPGGIGLAEGFLTNLPQIARGAREVVENCQCERGCPSCIGAPDEQQGAVDAKRAVRGFLGAWVGVLESAASSGAAAARET
jgi:DEAD/DEAH box helicase domain-containing protein